MIATITRAEIIALAKERESQVAFATREFIREHKAEPVKSHPAFVKGWANVTFCGVETALIVGRLAKWAACFEPSEVFTVETAEKHITITAQSVKSFVKLAIRQTITKAIDAPDKADGKDREFIGAPIVVTSDFGACTVAKGRDVKAEKAALKRDKAKLPAMEAMAKLQRNAREAIRLREIASGSLSLAISDAKCWRDALRQRRADARRTHGIMIKNFRHGAFSRARIAMKKWPAIKAALAKSYVDALNAWRVAYPSEPSTVATPSAPVSVESVAVETPAPLVPVSEKENTPPPCPGLPVEKPKAEKYRATLEKALGVKLKKLSFGAGSMKHHLIVEFIVTGRDIESQDARAQWMSVE